MAFYYTGLFAFVPLGIAYVLLAFPYMLVVAITRGSPKRALTLTIVGALFLVLPVSEELWIAWNFARACKTAGTVIHKKVTVEGFYDSTMRSAYENTKRGYRFVEQPDEDRIGVERVEVTGKESEAEALAWYAAKNPGKDFPKWIVYPVEERVQIVVSGGRAWKVTKLDKPTARYQFRMSDPMDGTPWGHKIGRSGSVVVDIKTGEELGRYTRFGRRPPWYFIGLDAPPYACDSPGGWPLARGNLLIFEDVLQQTERK